MPLTTESGVVYWRGNEPRWNGGPIELPRTLMYLRLISAIIY